MALRKTVADTLGNAVLEYGDTIKFAIKVFNQGSVSIDSLVINDTIPNGYTFVTPSGAINQGWVLSGNEANYTWGRTPMDTLLSGDSATVCIWLRLTSVAAGMKADYTNRAEISKAYGLGGADVSIQDIDGVLNSNYGDNPGGQPGSPADDFVLGTGTGAIGDGVAATDVDHADPAQITIVDVAMRKTIADTLGNAVLEYGDTIKFAIKIFNQGSLPIDSLVINDSIPNGYTFVTPSGAINQGWVLSVNEANYTWGRTPMDTLESGDSAIVCIWLKVNSVAAGMSADYTNRAEISTAYGLGGVDVSSQDIDSPLNDNYGDNGGGNPGSPADDAVTGNGTGAPGTSVPGTDQDNADPAQLNIVDVALRKTVADTLGNAVLEYGDTIKFAIKVFNQGSVPIDSLLINDTIPNGYTFVTPSGAINQGWVFSGNEANYTWGRTPMDTLLSGDSAIVCIWLRLTSVPAGMKADYTNRAEISKAYGLGGVDVSNQDIDGILNSNYGDNPGGQPGSPADDFVLGTGTGVIGDGVAATDVDHADPAQITIVDVAMRKTIADTLGNAVLEYGDTIKFAIKIFNQGSLPIDSLVINDSIPNGYTFVTPSGAINQGWVLSVNEANYTWGRTPMDTLESGDSAIVCIWLQVNSVAAGMSADYTNRAEISKAYGLGGVDVSSQDIDSPLNDNYGDNGGGNPGSPSDDSVTGNGTGAPGSGVAGTDQDNADPAEIRIVDVALRKTVADTLGNAVLEYGDTIKFSIKIFNQGSVPIDSLVINDTIPNGFTFVTPAGAINQGWTMAGNEANYTWGKTPNDTLISGDSATVFIWLKLNALPLGTKADYTNRAEISKAYGYDGVDVSNQDIDGVLNSIYADNPGGQPGSPADDFVGGTGAGTVGDGVAATDADHADPALITVVDFALRKTITTPGPYAIGDTVNFLITIYNQGNICGDSFVINDYVPSHLSLSPVLNPGWSGSGVATPAIMY
ncbi:MAG: DUF11 domain-containing protein [Saprospiraceae bacterium]|nr:DUF11 domain-containing protein [Saprospiraceae bacterium]